MKKLAIIRIRGQVRVKKEILDTMDMLKLYNQHCCVIYDSKPAIIGMIKKIKDYVTWGEIDDETIKLLIEKRGKPDPKDKTKNKAYFRLSPPKGGFERKGIKKTFKEGGVLGFRGEKIKDLILKMV